MIKLTKINRAKSYYTYGGEPIGETPSFELEYNYRKVMLTFYMDDYCKNLYVDCFYVDSERALSNYNMVTIVKRLKYTICKQLIIDYNKGIALSLIKQFKKRYLGTLNLNLLDCT